MNKQQMNGVPSASGAVKRPSKPVGFLLSAIGVTRTHSRHHVSNYSPYPESHFGTLKYRPGFASRIGSIQDAAPLPLTSSTGKTQEHHHRGISLLPPSSLHHGQAPDLLP